MSAGEQDMHDIEWTGGDLPNFVTHLECGLTGERYEAGVVQGLSKAASRSKCARMASILESRSSR